MNKLSNLVVVVLFLLYTLHFTLYTEVSYAKSQMYVTIVFLTGPVEVKVAGAWKRAEKKMTLTEKDEIRTGPGGKAILSLEDGSKLNLEGNTLLSIDELRENSTSLAMGKGGATANVKKLGSGGKFEIKTPASVCAVRGTKFRMDVADDGRTMTTCYRGSVNVRQVAGLGEEVTVRRFERVETSLDRPPTAPQPLNKEEKVAVMAPARTETTQEVQMGMSREAVQAAAAQEIKKAEYQQGKSLIDAFGYRVRLEEYIVRPEGTTDRFKMVVLNEREKRFDYFTWLAVFKDNAGGSTILPTDLTQATKWISWTSGNTKPDYYLNASKSDASNTVDIVSWGFEDGHIVDNSQSVSSNYEHFFDKYYFNINNNPKISYQPKSGNGIKNLVTDVNFYISGNLVGNYVTIDNTELNNFVNTYNQLYNPDITSLDAKNYWEFYTWWNTNVTPSQPSGSKLEHYQLQANFPGKGYPGNKIYNEDYYLIDDNGNIATTEQTAGLYDYSAQKWNKTELLKWNQELVMSGDEFNGPDKKIDLVVEPKIFIDAGIIQAK